MGVSKIRAHTKMMDGLKWKNPNIYLDDLGVTTIFG